jgi:cytochrome P450
MTTRPLWEFSRARERAEQIGVRRAGPLVASQSGAIYPTRSEDIVALLRDTTRLTHPMRGHDDAHPWVPTGAAPAEHARYRAVLDPLFRPRALAWLMPSIQEHATELVDTVAARGQCDVVAELARPLSVQTLLTLLGLPADNLEKLLRLLAQQAALPRSAPFRVELIEYARQAVPIAAPPGVISALRGTFEDAEILSFVLLLFGAAIETTTATISFALFELATDPQLRALLLRRPDQMGTFVNEVARVYSPIGYCPRVTLEEMKIGGVSVPPHTELELSLRTLNLDAGHLITYGDDKVRGCPFYAFGAGSRRCLGMHLARAQMSVLVGEFLRRITRFTLTPPGRVELNVGGNSSTRLGPTALLLQWST